ncbi:MAG: HmuY family protein [Deltaproteobacteria bacterium]|nr:HmuY family protein [Deltaproteobacteria bacterium]
MRILRPIALCVLVAACGGDPSTPADVDAAVAIDATAGCDPTTALPTQWRPIAMTSTGALTVTTANGVTSGTIDATAGGTAAAADNPYVYLDLMSGTKVDITDTASLSSTAWHVAFKRAGIKLNGGDSGPGTVSAASVDAATLAEVTAAPTGLAVDDWADASCALVAGPTGEPATVMSAWYDYDSQTHVLTPKAQVWVIQIAPGVYRKLRIETYYGDPANTMRGAYYKVEWAAL